MHTTLPHRLAAVWFADIVGYGRLAASNEDETLHYVRLFERACRSVVRRHNGRLVKFMGDAALAEFSSTERAVRAACVLESTFQGLAAKSGLTAPSLHIGVHVGEVASAPDGDLYGEAVNLASRLQGLAAPGQVLVSEDVRRQLHHRPEFAFERLGERTIKDSDQPVLVHCVVAQTTAAREAGEEGIGVQWRALHHELVQRRVFRAVASYAILGILVVTAAAVTVPRLGGPGWIVQVVTFLVVLVLPLIVLLAWTFEIGRDGLRRHESFYDEAGTLLLRSAYGALVLAAILAAGGIALVAFETGPSAEARAILPINRIAVLYFEDFTPGGDLRHLVDGLTDLLIQKLSRVPGLEVVSRNGVKPYEGTDVPPDSIARALGAGTLVQGTVAESGGRLRLTVQLIDGPSGTLIESQTLERPPGELFELQDDLAEQVTEFLRRRLGRKIVLAQMRSGTESVTAWELVQRAERLREDAEPLVQAGELEEAGRIYDQADALLVRAQAMDSTWAQPSLQRGWLAYHRSLWTRTGDVPTFLRWNRVGLNHAEAALRIAPDDADALELRGTLRGSLAIYAPESDPSLAAAQLENAVRDLRSAIEADPGQAGAWLMLSTVLAAQGKVREAKIAVERAYEADAYFLLDGQELVWKLFTASYDANDPAEAERWCQEWNRRHPDDRLSPYCQIWLMTMPGIPAEPERSWSLVEEYERLVPPHLERHKRVARMAQSAILVRAGLPDSALAVAARARADERVDPTRNLMYYEAFVRTLAGQEAEAVGLLISHIQATPAQRGEVAATWFFCDLWDRPDFRALVGVDDSAEPPESCTPTTPAAG